jgi:CopG family nickel-responsive transcriptional regulator
MLTRIGVSMQKAELKQCELLIRKFGYSSRSECIREAMKHYIGQSEKLDRQDEKQLGIIVILYEPVREGVMNSLDRIQLMYQEMTLNRFDFFNEDDACVRMLVTEGEGKAIAELSDRFMDIKGVRQVRHLKFCLES